MTVEAALNTVEFRLRENNTGSFPRGIVFMLRSLRDWLHRPRSAVAACLRGAARRRQGAASPAASAISRTLIRRHFIDNPPSHRSDPAAGPAAGRARGRGGAAAARTRARRHEPRPNSRPRSRRRTRSSACRRRPTRPRRSPPYRPSSLPTCRAATSSSRSRSLTLRDTPVLYHDLFTNGDRLSRHRLRPASAAGRSLALCDPVRPCAARDRRRQRGFRAPVAADRPRDRRHPAAAMDLDGARRRRPARPGSTCAARRCPSQTGELLAILRDILTGARLDNRERFQQLVLEEKAALEFAARADGVELCGPPPARQFPRSRLGRRADGRPRATCSSCASSPTQVETDWDAVHGRARTHPHIPWSTAPPCLRTSPPSLPIGALAAAARGLSWRPCRSPRRRRRPGGSPTSRMSEGLVIPAKVNYVGKGADLYDARRQAERRPPGDPPLSAHHLAVGQGPGAGRRLWRPMHVRPLFRRLHLRVLPRPQPSRRPSISTTGPREFLKQADLGEAELARNIIGTIGEIDTYRLPDAKGFASMQRHLIGDTDEARQRMREEILSTTRRRDQGFRRRHGGGRGPRPRRRARLRAGDRGRQCATSGAADRVAGDVRPGSPFRGARILGRITRGSITPMQVRCG